MDIDSKCYDLIAGAGLEPILQGGRGRASGFIMRMMAENKLKHKGDYKNPTSPLDPNSKMKSPVAFDYRKLANRSQQGTSKSKYGASPFIIKHFANQPVPFRSRAQRLAEGDSEAEVPGETDEQKEARLRTTAEGLLEKARELAGLRETKKKAATKIQSLSKIRKSIKFVKGLKAEKGKAAAEAKAKADAAAKTEEDAKKQRALYKKLYGREPDTPAQAAEARRTQALKAIGVIPMSERDFGFFFSQKR